MDNDVQMIYETKLYTKETIHELEKLLKIATKLSDNLTYSEMKLLMDWLKNGGVYEVYCAFDYQLNPFDYYKFIERNQKPPFEILR